MNLGDLGVCPRISPRVIFWRVEVAKDRSFKTRAEQLRLRNDFCVRTCDPGVHTPVFAHQTMRNFGQQRLPDTEAQRKLGPNLARHYAAARSFDSGPQIE